MTVLDAVIFALIWLAYPTVFLLWLFWRESNKAIIRHNAQPSEVWMKDVEQ